MYVMMMFGLLPIILAFVLFGFLIGRVAKKRGKNPWLWSGATIIFLAAITWQKLPRWAGTMTVWELTALHAMTAQPSKIVEPNAVEHFMLRSQSHHENTYTFGLPAQYRAEYSPEYLIEVVCKYPSMEASPGSLFPNESVVDMYITTAKGYMGRPQLFLQQVSDNKVFGEFVGKQGEYDLYQTKNVVTGEFDKTWLFTAKDGQMVLVEPSLDDNHRAWRKISPDMAVNYSFSSTLLGNDFIKIDEAVVGFIKAHLQSQSTQIKETDK